MEKKALMAHKQMWRLVHEKMKNSKNFTAHSLKEFKKDYVKTLDPSIQEMFSVRNCLFCTKYYNNNKCWKCELHEDNIDEENLNDQKKTLQAITEKNDLVIKNISELIGEE